MSRIKDLFQRKTGRVLNIYCTAGYPQLDSTLVVMEALQENGADMIELGIPYSDPLADGPVIQQSSAVAISNGMTIAKLFEQLVDMRSPQSSSTAIHVPVVLMGYMNPVLQYGFDRFCSDAALVGIDGLILPDLPEHEFVEEYDPVIKRYGLDFIFLVTPETSDERIKRLDKLSSGFLYAVSSSSTTGNQDVSASFDAFLQRLRGLRLKNPVLVGFGIRDRAGFEAACEYVSGAIIGSAFIKSFDGSKSIPDATRSFLSGILG